MQHICFYVKKFYIIQERQTLSFYTFILPAAIFLYASLCDIEHTKRKSMENTQYKVSRFTPYYFRIPATITFDILHYVQSHEKEKYFLLCRKVFLIDIYVKEDIPSNYYYSIKYEKIFSSKTAPNYKMWNKVSHFLFTTREVDLLILSLKAMSYPKITSGFCSKI